MSFNSELKVSESANTNSDVVNSNNSDLGSMTISKNSDSNTAPNAIPSSTTLKVEALSSDDCKISQENLVDLMDFIRVSRELIGARWDVNTMKITDYSVLNDSQIKDLFHQAIKTTKEPVSFPTMDKVHDWITLSEEEKNERLNKIEPEEEKAGQSGKNNDPHSLYNLASQIWTKLTDAHEDMKTLILKHPVFSLASVIICLASRLFLGTLWFFLEIPVLLTLIWVLQVGKNLTGEATQQEIVNNAKAEINYVTNIYNQVER